MPISLQVVPPYTVVQLGFKDKDLEQVIRENEYKQSP